MPVEKIFGRRAGRGKRKGGGASRHRPPFFSLIFMVGGARKLEAFGFSGLDDLCEIAGVQTSSADQGAIDVGLPQKLGGI